MKNFIQDLDNYNELPVARQMEMTLQINEVLPSVPVILQRAVVREAVKNMLIKQMARLGQEDISNMYMIKDTTRAQLKKVI